MESSSSDIVLLTPGRLAGTVAAPPLKALLTALSFARLSALSGNGSCFVHPLAASEDITVTLEAAKALGCSVIRKQDGALISRLAERRMGRKFPLP